ncbi:MAG: AAA family ATPase [Polyangiaceae bacterium]
MLKLRRLKILKYRGVTPNIALVFDDQWNVILGKNGTGKTTLLRIVETVISSDFTELALEEFHLEYEISVPGVEDVPGATVTCTVRNERNVPTADPATPTSLSTDDEQRLVAQAPRGLTLALTANVVFVFANGDRVAVHADRASLTVEGSGETRQAQPGIVAGWLIPSIILCSALDNGTRIAPSIKNNLIGLFRQISPRLMSDSVRRFDEALDVFQALVTQSPLLPPSHGAPSLTAYFDDPTPPLLGLAAPAHTLPTPSVLSSFMVPEFVGEIASYLLDPKHVESPQSLVLDHEKLPFLLRAVTAFGFSSAQAILLFREKRVTKGKVNFDYGPLAFRFERPNGSILRHELLSYGQKRLLAFLYYVAANPTTIIADELVNGLHYEWIELCLGLMGDRQRFLTSQNPLLLDHLTFTSAPEASARFIRCTSENDTMVWSNLAVSDGERFYRAYQSGIQYVGEILRTEGLW